MELMSISLDKMYKYVFDRKQETIPEDILGKITITVTIIFDNHLVLIAGAVEIQRTWKVCSYTMTGICEVSSS